MNVILGIDTGGTYTDGVLIRCDNRQIIRGAKAFTTKDCLCNGIRSCIERLNITDEEKISLVCLSTTLATNAVVEGKGATVGLIRIGDTPGEETKNKYPACIDVGIDGKIDIRGREITPVSETDIHSAISKMKDRIEALAISGYASVRNQMHELHVKRIAEEMLDIPIVCAHELTNTLGFYERTVTAVLNAKLLPVIQELIDDTKQILAEKDIEAHIAIVKGDGHLMIDSFAEAHPIETILSGPAASIRGGGFMTGVDSAIIVDMGGTTTDIAITQNGEAPLEKEGASVGGWLTRVSASRICTTGLGGDSYIRQDTFGEIIFGPGRVIPLCVAAEEYPNLCRELQQYKKNVKYAVVDRQETDCIKLFKDKNRASDKLNTMNKEILELLEDGAHSVLYLSSIIGRDIENLEIDKLLELELVQLISMTPTDILHATGEYIMWNRQASVIGAEIFAKNMGITSFEFLDKTSKLFVHHVSAAVLESAFCADGISKFGSNDKILGAFINNALSGDNEMIIDYRLKLNKPIIGIGAPASSWIRKVAKALNTTLILPCHESVANAVGAAVSDIHEVLSATIYYDPHISKFTVYLPKERVLFDELDEAKKFARREIEECARGLAEELVADDASIEIEENDEYIDNVCTGGKTYIKSVLNAVITGKIKCLNLN